MIASFQNWAGPRFGGYIFRFPSSQGPLLTEARRSFSDVAIPALLFAQ